jgi:hypothetical protein
MLNILTEVLTEEELQQVRALITEAEFEDGKATAGRPGSARSTAKCHWPMWSGGWPQVSTSRTTTASAYACSIQARCPTPIRATAARCAWATSSEGCVESSNSSGAGCSAVKGLADFMSVLAKDRARQC